MTIYILRQPTSRTRVPQLQVGRVESHFGELVSFPAEPNSNGEEGDILPLSGPPALAFESLPTPGCRLCHRLTSFASAEAPTSLVELPATKSHTYTL